MFGQRAMKVVNNVEVKEELDYESFCRKLQGQVDNLTSEIERQEKLRESEKTKLEKRLKDCEISLAKAEHNLSLKSENQLENSTYQKVLADTTQMYEKKIVELTKQLGYEQSRSAGLEKELVDDKNSLKVQQAIVEELNLKLQSMSKLNEEGGSKIHSLEAANSELMSTKESLDEEVKAVHKKLLGEQRQMKHREDEIVKLKLLVSDQVKNMSKDENLIKPVSGLGQTDIYQSSKPRETLSSQKATTVSKIFEEVGFPNMFAMFRSENLDVQTHAAKVIANLAADDANQERIVEEGGLDALLLLLETSKDTTIHRITAGAIANLAMNGMNQGLIMSKGGARLLSNIAYVTNDPQTLRMVAGAIANLCGNEKLHEMLKDDGAIRALLTMANCGHSEVIAQIARGIANFAKCESRAIREGHKKGRSLLLEEGVLSWLVANSASYSNSTRRHIELALCHLAQNDDNCYDIVLAQGVKQLLHISQESSKEDIRNLAKRALDNPIFSSQLLML